MKFTIAEKLQIAMLCDLSKPAEERALDFEFIREAVTNNDIWALSWKYPGLELAVATPEPVSLVIDILEMFNQLELAHDGLDSVAKDRVAKESLGSGTPYFRGFDGKSETGLMHIARLFVNHLDLWSRFKGRDLNSHWPMIDAYRRMLCVWRSIMEIKAKELDGFGLAADDIIAIVRERIHPENRQALPGGGWTIDPSKRFA